MTAALGQAPGSKVAAVVTLCAACGGALSPARRHGAARLAQCATCDSRTAVPRPSAEQLASLHDSPQYYDKTYFEGRRGRDDTAERRFRRLLDILPTAGLAGRRMLDVGCDTGEFVAVAARVAGIEPFGVDVASRPLEAARDRGIRTFCGQLADAPFADFAVITAIDVLEHVSEPSAFLEAGRARLAPDGLLYVETPNWKSPVYAVGAAVARFEPANRTKALERLFPPEHVQYFTHDGLERVAARAGLRPTALFTRRMDPAATGIAVRAAIEALQPRRRELLLCALLERA